MAETLSAPADDVRDETDASPWLEQLRLADREEKDWRQDAEKIVERLRGEKSELNILAANVQLLQPNVYSQAPAPDVRRRNILEDPLSQAIGREVATLIEKALSFAIDDGKFDPAMLRVRDDVLTVGRGVSREVYEATIVRRDDVVEETIPNPGDLMGTPTIVYLLDGQPVEPEFDPKTGAPFVEIKTAESVETEYVFWSDFRMAPARRWEDVQWVAFRHAMPRAQLVKEFKALGREVPLTIIGKHGEARDSGHDPDTRAPADPPARHSRAEVWECWDKETRTRVWVAKGFDKRLRTDPDPLGLQGFYPCAAPVYGVTTTDTMVPLPEFELYRKQADELDVIQARIRHLETVLRAVVLTDGISARLSRSRTPGTASRSRSSGRASAWRISPSRFSGGRWKPWSA